MKVKDLIEELKKHDENLEVRYATSDYGLVPIHMITPRQIVHYYPAHLDSKPLTSYDILEVH